MSQAAPHPDEEPLGCFDQVKAFFVTIGTIGAGLFALLPPADLLAEMRETLTDSARQAFGVSFLAYGALFGLTAFFASGSGRRSQAVATRLKGLLFATVAAAVAALLVCTIGARVRDAAMLAERGRPATAVVIRSRLVMRKDRTAALHTIAYSGHRAELRLTPMRKAGETLSVLYLADRPKVVLPGRAGDGFIDLVAAGPGTIASAGAGAIVLGALLVALFGLKRFLFGRGRPPEAQAA